MRKSNNNEENIQQIFEMIYNNLYGKTCFNIGN